MVIEMNQERFDGMQTELVGSRTLVRSSRNQRLTMLACTFAATLVNLCVGSPNKSLLLCQSLCM